MNYLCETCHKIIPEENTVLLLEKEWLKFITGAPDPMILGIYGNHRHYVCKSHVIERYPDVEPDQP